MARVRFIVCIVALVVASGAGSAQWSTLSIAAQYDSWIQDHGPAANPRYTTVTDTINLQPLNFGNQSLANPHVQYTDDGSWLIMNYGDNSLGDTSVCDAIYVVTRNPDGTFVIPGSPVLSYPPDGTQCGGGNYLGAGAGIAKTPSHTTAHYKYFALVTAGDNAKGQGWVTWAASSDGKVWQFAAAGGGATTDPKQSMHLVAKSNLEATCTYCSPPGQPHFLHTALLYNPKDNYFYMVIGYGGLGGITATWWRMAFNSSNAFGLSLTNGGAPILGLLSNGTYVSSSGVVPDDDTWQIAAMSPPGAADPMDLVQLYNQDGTVESTLFLYQAATRYGQIPPPNTYVRGALPLNSTAQFAWGPSQLFTFPPGFTTTYSACGAGGNYMMAVNQSGWQVDGRPQLYGFVTARRRVPYGPATDPLSGGDATCAPLVQGLVMVKFRACSTITVSPSSVPTGMAGVAYPSVAFSQAGGAAPATFSESGLLPAGMTFLGGVLSGTPTQTGTFPIAVTSTDAVGCAGTQNVTITIAAPPTVSSLTLNPTTVQAGNASMATVTLSGAAPAGGAKVLLSSSDPSRASVQSSVTVAAGSIASQPFPVNTAVVVARGLPPVTISASYGGSTKTADLAIAIPTVPRPRTIVVPPRAGGGSSFSATVQMNSPAPAGGLTVTLSLTSPAVPVPSSVPPSVFVPAGATVSQAFTVTTTVVSASTAVTITGTYQGNSATATFYVDPPVYDGYLDSADCNALSGWAWDANRPNTPITVDIYANGVKQATGVAANLYRADLVAAGKGNGYHAFVWTVTQGLKTGATYSMVANYGGTATALGATPKAITCPPPSVSVAWVKPAEVTWGPAGTLTVAGYAQNGTGGVTMYWRDATLNGGWNVVAYVAPPDATHVWYNTIPSSDNCHTYQVYGTYSAVTSSVFTYTGLSSGYCQEAAHVIWMQPQALAGFGPPGSIVLAGSAAGAPAGTVIQLWSRDVTAGTGWSNQGAALPNGSGIWYGAIQGANTAHVYAAYVTYDVITSATCNYAGNNAMNWCP